MSEKKDKDFYKNKTISFDKNTEKEFYQMIAKNVKKARMERGVSLFELALGIGHQSTSFIHAAELAKDRHYNLVTLKKISLFLDVPFIDFFSEN